jgi:diguanylate cyclase (GGDEF)-like protein
MVREREWSVAELDALKIAANVFGAVIERQMAEEEIYQINSELEQRIEQRTTQLQEANQNLNREKGLLEQYTRQREIMATMTDLLQASITMEEASTIVSTHFKLLFPNRDGALHLTNSSNSFEPVAIWGEKKSLDVIYNANECWALRRGKSYRFGVRSPNPPCTHLGKDVPQHALCIPLSAQGESLGNLHISTQNNHDTEFINDEEERFIETIADSIALAIANLRLREKLHFESIRDGLTGLFNRRYLDETLPREIHRAERSNRPISVFMFDIDHFKKFNDTFGHDAGDVVLKSLAGLILSDIRDSDIACRYGGEEFTIILPDTPIEVAARRAENLRHEASLMELHHNGQNLGKVTISIGVATYPQHGTTRDTLIKSADEAAYRAKEGGRNQVVVCQ